MTALTISTFAYYNERFLRVRNIKEYAHYFSSFRVLLDAELNSTVRVFENRCFLLY